jgi:hypothetical protein
MGFLVNPRKADSSEFSLPCLEEQAVAAEEMRPHIQLWIHNENGSPRNPSTVYGTLHNLFCSKYLQLSSEEFATPSYPGSHSSRKATTEFQTFLNPLTKYLFKLSNLIGRPSICRTCHWQWLYKMGFRR